MREARQDREPCVRSPDAGGPPPAKRLTASVDDFTLHADTVVAAHDRDGLERLARYGARPPFLYQGRVHAVGTPAELRASADPVVQQFITGAATGPMETPGF